MNLSFGKEVDGISLADFEWISKLAKKYRERRLKTFNGFGCQATELTVTYKVIKMIQGDGGQEIGKETTPLYRNLTQDQESMSTI